jgi:hypothetical protein
MKHLVLAIIFLASLFPLAGRAQLNNGGLYSFFGVDADTRANYLKYGIAAGNTASDDWFASASPGTNVIDISNAAIYLAQLKSGQNITFSKRMSQLMYAKVNGRLWLDAAYGRDYSSASALKDSTVFTSSNKNGDDPNSWTGGVTNTPAKNDLVDVYAHMRRDGTSVYDSLWFFTAASTFGTTGNSYYDVELYKQSFGYNTGSHTFSSAGTSGGHTEWIFDASGNITQTGDLIVAVTSTGAVPLIDVRIWVSQTTFNTYYGGSLAPKYFNFNGAYSSSSGTYGYASIVSKTGSTAFGGGIANYSATTTKDSTYATPWGTSSTVAMWGTQYQTQQLTEVGLNMTRIGLDPALYSALNPCQSLFANVFFKSRSSASFTSALQDFVIPLTFLRPPVMDYSEKGDTIRCNNSPAKITLTNNSTAGYYTWQALNGGTISGANSDSSQLSITKPGTYIVSASPAQGCPPTRVDTLIVPIDTFPPIASGLVGLSGGNLDFFGGDVVASNYATPFGGSNGLTWNWTGPNGFTSTTGNPVTDTTWGNYSVTVTEKRNGCTASASVNVVSSMFTVLLANGLQVNGAAADQVISLDWKDLNPSIDLSYVIERSDGKGGFEAIGSVMNNIGATKSFFSYTDGQPLGGSNFYRIRATTITGESYYSKTILVTLDPSAMTNVFLAGANPGDLSLVVRTPRAGHGVLGVYSVAGQTLEKKEVALASGSNTLPLSNLHKRSIQVVVLWIDGRMVWSQKVVN